MVVNQTTDANYKVNLKINYWFTNRTKVWNMEVISVNIAISSIIENLLQPHVNT